MLPRRRLGQTELEPSVIGLGTVKFGRTQNLKYPSDFALPSDQQLRELLACARDMGINLLDTAPAYGYSEERLGELLRRERQDWLICTKVGEEFEHDKHSAQGKSWFDYSARHTRHSIERSLRRLRSDYLDLVLIHSDGNDLHILEQTEVLGCLQQMKREGWIRALGISSKTLEGGQRAAALCDAVMVTYNRDHSEEAPVIEACQASGCGVLLKKVLASGHICHDAPAPGAADPVQQALAFALTKAGVTSALLGTINPAHLRANCLKALAALAQ